MNQCHKNRLNRLFPTTGKSTRFATCVRYQPSVRVRREQLLDQWLWHAIDSGPSKKRFVLSRSLFTAEQTTYSTLPRASVSCPANNIFT